MKLSRRDFVKFVPTLIALGFMPKTLFADTPPAATPGHSGYNFAYIYKNPDLRDRFHQFLQNVYSLYPDPQAHKLIIELTSSHHTDEDIYKDLQKKFPDIKPFMSIFRKALPALSKQKAEMRKETSTLIADMKKADGYVEIGTTGRYYEGIKHTLKLKGQTYLINTDGPTYTPGDMVDRGHLVKVGKFIKLGDYDAVTAKKIEPESIDLVSNYIGFHHAPPDKRDAFIGSVAKTIRPGGRLVLRDHDADDNDMKFIAALAHDVFNAGLDISWEKNMAEIRNFTSIDEIAEKVAQYGMEPQKSRLLQEGDPTRNTLMVFVKT